MRPDAMILVFQMLSFKPTFSLSTFTFIKRLFSFSSLSAIRVVSSAYLTSVQHQSPFLRQKKQNKLKLKWTELVKTRSPTNVLFNFLKKVLLSQNLLSCYRFILHFWETMIFLDAIKLKWIKLFYIDIITQFSRFKSKNNRIGLLLWDGMRKNLINDYEAFWNFICHIKLL